MSSISGISASAAQAPQSTSASTNAGAVRARRDAAVSADAASESRRMDTAQISAEARAMLEAEQSDAGT